MARTWLTWIGLLIVATLVAACEYAAGDLAIETATPAPSYQLQEIISADVTACEPQSVSGDSMVRNIAGSNLLALDVFGPDGGDCLFDFRDDAGTAYSRFSCRVPRSLGRVIVYEFDKGVDDISGYRYGHQFSWDLGGLCTLEGCSEGTVFPEDCRGSY